MSEISLKDQEHQVKKVQRLLEGWRMALLPLKSVILWEQQWHPCAIMGAMTILHLAVWLLDFNSLTTLAMIGLLINFIDFAVPIICNSVYGPSSWTGQKQKVFEDICKGIVVNYNVILSKIQSFYSLRENSPCMFYMISISMLLTLAWVASSINNIFLVYMLSTVLMLWPGIQQKGIMKPLLALINKTKTIKPE